MESMAQTPGADENAPSLILTRVPLVPSKGVLQVAVPNWLSSVSPISRLSGRLQFGRSHLRGCAHHPPLFHVYAEVVTYGLSSGLSVPPTARFELSKEQTPGHDCDFITAKSAHCVAP